MTYCSKKYPFYIEPKFVFAEILAKGKRGPAVSYRDTRLVNKPQLK
jgi:hypothetical protein